MTPMLLWSGIGDLFSSLMNPLYTAISAVLVGAYRVWSHVTGEGSGTTWVLAIVSLTVMVRIILIPLFIRQINSSRNMQLIQPKMKALQDKYGADRQKLSIETQKLMKEEGVNPMASCFPLLLQMPVFWALYRVLWNAGNGTPVGHFLSGEGNAALAQSLKNATFLGADVSGHFMTSNLTTAAGWGATQIVALVLIVVMTVLFFITQKQLMSKNMPPESMTGPMAQQQKMMLYLFPLMYLFMGLMIQIGVLIYWVTSNLWTLGQQWLLIHNNPTPGTPAFVDWEERMIRKGKDPHEIQEARLAKRSKTKAPAAPASRTVTTNAAGDTTAPAPEVAVQRQAVVVQRQQVTKQSRAQRKKQTTKQR